MDGYKKTNVDEVYGQDKENTSTIEECRSEQTSTEISGRTQESMMEQIVSGDGVKRDLIQYIVGLLDKVKVSSEGLESATDAQFNFIQNLVNKHAEQFEKQSSSWFALYKSILKDTGHQPDDVVVNQMEILTLTSHQNSIMCQTRIVGDTIGELYCTLKTSASLQRLFVSATEPIPTKRVHLPPALNRFKEMIKSQKSSNQNVPTKNAGMSVDANCMQEQEKDALVGANDNDLLEKKDSLLKEIGDLKEALVAKSRLYEHLQQQFEEESSKLLKCNEQCEKSNSHLSQMEDELTTLRKKYSEYELNLNSLQKHVEEIQKEKEILNTELTVNKENYEELDKQYNKIRFQKEKMSKEVSELKDRNSNLEGGIDEKIHECDTLKQKYEKASKDKDHLHNENTRLSKCRDNLERDLETDRGQIKNLNSVIGDKNNEITDLKSKLSQLDEKYHDLDKQKVDLSANVDALQSTIKDMTKKINNRDSTVDNLQDLLENKDSELQQRDSTINALEENRICNDLELQKVRLELQKVTNNVITLENKVCDETKENERLKERNSNLNNKKAKLERECLNNKSELYKADKKMELMNRELKKLQKWKREYDDELERQRMRKKAILYIPRRGDLVSMVVSDMSARLISLFESNKSGLEFEEVDSVSRIEPNTPVLVFCINASRLGTDVSNALTGIRVSPQVAVVVLHHKEQHALPNQSSERVLTSTEYKSIGGIFDMACLSSKGGLYECEMNTSAIRGLFEFIKQRNTQ